jgi:kynurenine aminotransferase
MNFGPPKWVTDAADVALKTAETNHYAHPKGRLRLRKAIKNFYGPQLGRNLDVETEILVSSGANEG